MEAGIPSSATILGQRLVCSWSGGKDCCLALNRAAKAGGSPSHLVTMFTAGGVRSRNHGLAIEVIAAQAEAIGLPLVTVAAAWPEYEQNLVAALRRLSAEGIEGAVFGDIDIAAHRQWEEDVCAAAGLHAHLPLWQSSRRALLDEMLKEGFVARIVAVNAEQLGKEWLGRILDAQLVADLEQTGVDACGENGEYHTVVVDGPPFCHSLRLRTGDAVLRSGYWFLDYHLD